MPSTLVNSRDLEFMLYEFLDVEALTQRPRFAEHSRATFDGALATARQLAEKHFAPHNRKSKSDENEPRWDGEKVTIIPEVKAALDAFAGAGFMAALADLSDGGMQLPESVAQAAFCHFHAANVATTAYAFLTVAAGNLIAAFGSAEQKALYLPPMRAGRYFGTMVLTEPQAGSSLGDIRTRAEPQPDGSYHLTGSKIFISGGDHEMSENIIHLVLAKIAGAPPGVHGISLFLVPKYRVNPDGTRGTRNGVTLAGLIHKLGYRGTTSTMLNFGEGAPCTGHLLGRPHEGLRQMFHMMNEARITVGLGAAMLGYTGYLQSLDYARNRSQGRLPSAKDPLAPPVRLIEHADIRRMLLQQKAYVEGALALCLFAARLVDDERTAPEEGDRERARLLLDLLTPIVKAWPSDFGIAANNLALQVFGGYGYTRDYPIEQLLRDNRLNPIHEGTNGIQAIDLLGRKVRMENGAAFQVLCDAVRDTLAAAESHPTLAGIAVPLASGLEQASTVTRSLTAAIAKDPDRGLANASLYLDMLARVVVGWLWLEQALIAAEALRDGTAEADFYRGKLQAARWYARVELTQVAQQAALLGALEATAYEMREPWF
jgi:butyryl-CoA dehydrogenase